ncbi:MAG: hypothetical protein JKX82_04970 [Oleispira sp.]|nr:hypothetical protein [Oleispira sp.]
MFVEKKLKLNEAMGLVEIIQEVKSEFHIIPFKLNHRFNRQLAKLSSATKEAGEIKSKSLEAVLGEEAYQKAVEKSQQLSEVMTEGQLKEYVGLMAEEMESEITVGLLSASFEDLIGNPDLDKKVADQLSVLVGFHEELVWNVAE